MKLNKNLIDLYKINTPKIKYLDKLSSIIKIGCRNRCFHWGRRGCDRMVVGFTITYAISAYHH